jgi:hypothetical protein
MATKQTNTTNVMGLLFLNELNILKLSLFSFLIIELGFDFTL